MEKIIQIHYQNRNISIEENAYQSFLQYETDLKNYFLKEEDGEETFSDLQNRMAEIFEEKIKNGKTAIQQMDIDELKANIGQPNEFEHEEKQQTANQQHTTSEKATKKLFRNKDKSNRIIAGVCSGIANYMQVDPIAIRLIFVLFALFNIITFFKLNLAVLGYILLWIVLPVSEKVVNVHHKFFRNPKDKVLGGICSGLAQFFNTESWIVRSVFLFPLLIGIFGNHHNWFHGNGFFHVHSIAGSIASLSLIIYIILWIISPIAQSNTDYMLLKGEPITINTIQHSNAKQSISNEAKSSLNVFLKIVAYIFIGLFLLVLIPTSFGFFVGGLFVYKIASIILFSSLYKTLALVCLFGFIAMPLISVMVWLVRRIAGYRSQHKLLRIAFSSISFIGFLCGALLVFYLITEMNTYVGIKNKYNVHTISDTLYVESVNEDTLKKNNVFFDLNSFNNLVKSKANEHEIKAVRLKYTESNDTSCLVIVEQTSFGRDEENATQNSQVFSYTPIIENNHIKLPTFISISNKIPYRMQNVIVTIIVPKNKHLVVSKKLKQELSKSFRAGKKGVYIKYNDDFDKENKYEVITNDDGSTTTTTTTTTYIDDDGISISEVRNDEKKSPDEKAKENIKEAQEKLNETLKQNEENLKESQLKLDEQIRENNRKIEEANRKIEEAQREHNRVIEEANEKIKKASN